MNKHTPAAFKKLQAEKAELEKKLSESEATRYALFVRMNDLEKESLLRIREIHAAKEETLVWKKEADDWRNVNDYNAKACDVAREEASELKEELQVMTLDRDILLRLVKASHGAVQELADTIKSLVV